MAGIIFSAENSLLEYNRHANKVLEDNTHGKNENKETYTRKTRALQGALV